MTDKVFGNISVKLSTESVSSMITSKVTAYEQKDKADAFFVCDLKDVINKFDTWMKELPRVEPFYAVKCNDDTAILSLLAQLGTGFDCASKGEIQKVLSLGVDPDRLIYANPCKQASHIKYATQRGVELMTFDNETELHKIKTLYPMAKLVIRILPPNNSNCQCQLGMKFGCQPKQATKLLRVAKQLELDVIGVSFHVGSGCYDTRAYSAAVSVARDVFDTARLEGFQFRLLDIGGGFPGQKDVAVSFQEIAAELRSTLDQHFPEESGVHIIAEPGRFFAASAFTLTLNVIARRVITKGEIDLELDDIMAGDDEHMFMYYLNDGVYGSFNCIIYDHAVVRPHLFQPEKYVGATVFSCSLWGPTCDGLDCIMKECYLPKLNTGDWLVFPNMGAYTMSAASTFNGMAKPKCYYVTGETSRNGSAIDAAVPMPTLIAAGHKPMKFDRIDMQSECEQLAETNDALQSLEAWM